MLTLATRIQRLEIAITPTERSCSVCGAPGTNPIFTVHMDGYDPPSDTPEYCPGCGRRQVFRLEFDSPDQIDLCA